MLRFGSCSRDSRLPGLFSYRALDLAPMPEQDAKLFEILISKIRENARINPILDETVSVLL